MRYILVSLMILLANNISYASERLGNLVFPSEKNILLSQFTPITDADFNLFKALFAKEIRTDPYCGTTSERLSTKDVIKYDVSGDGVDDFVFSSYCGSEEIRNFIWIRKGPSLSYAGFIKGTPTKFFRNKESEPYSMVVEKGWCCDAYVGSIILYKLKEDNGALTYMPEKKVMEFGSLTVPDKIMAPVRFLVRNDKYRLRSSPEINDEYDTDRSSHYGEPAYGNIIAVFPRGSRGEAVAEHKDTAGRVWWFVLMDKDAKAITNHFYDDAGGYKTGWMSSRYLETTK